MKEINLQIKKYQQTPNGINSETHKRDIIIKLSKIKERELKATRQKWLIMHKGSPIRLSVDSSSETLETKGEKSGMTCLKG